MTMSRGAPVSCCFWLRRSAMTRFFMRTCACTAPMSREPPAGADVRPQRAVPAWHLTSAALRCTALPASEPLLVRAAPMLSVTPAMRCQILLHLCAQCRVRKVYCMGHNLSYPHPNALPLPLLSRHFMSGAHSTVHVAFPRTQSASISFGGMALQYNARTHPAACWQNCLRHLRPLSCWWGWGPGCMGPSSAAAQPPQTGWPPLIACSDPAQMHCTWGTAHGTIASACQDTDWAALVYASTGRCLFQPWHMQHAMHPEAPHLLRRRRCRLVEELLGWAPPQRRRLRRRPCTPSSARLLGKPCMVHRFFCQAE